MLKDLYKSSLALLTDLYELSMSYAYWKEGLQNKEAVFHHFFRKKPFNGGFTIAAGLESFVQYVNDFKFQEDDIAYLSLLKAYDGTPLFSHDFLRYLQEMPFSCDIDAVPEGTVVFPYEPMVRVKGPLIQCQILESILLNIINFQTLIATKAARICMAAKNDEVLEFGLRRAQGIDGALSASRAAFIGGCHATSNVLAGKMYGIPVKGTHAHSWVMIFPSELEAFQAYARSMPNNCVFLVDTYDTLNGVRNAIQVGEWLRDRGKKMLGIRLDSGDLAYLSIESRKLLDAAGFEDAVIIASNELDETIISNLKLQGATIGVWGVGTNLVTAKGQPALDGVYKLSAVRDSGGQWDYKVKLSEQMLKISNPGVLQVRRYYNTQENRADVIYDINMPSEGGRCTIIDPLDATRQKVVEDNLRYRDLLIPIFREGKCVYDSPPLKEIRRNTKKELEGFHSGVKRFINPHEYVVGMEKSLFDKKIKLVKKIRAEASQNEKYIGML